MLFYAETPLKFAFSKEMDKGDKTFLKVQDDQKKVFGLLGVPFDSTTTYRPGARYGPLLLRESSYNFESYNLYLDKELEAEFYDMGDMQIVPGNFKKTCKQVQFTIKEILNLGLVPLVMGGDHSISYPVTRALDIRKASVIHFDAHTDLRDDYAGEKYSHATVMRRIFELKPQRIIQIGVRSSSEEEVEFARENGVVQFTARDVRKGIDVVVDNLASLEGPIYVTVDMDVLDPAYAPSVGTPAPGGLSPLELETLILSLKDIDIMGLDVVEVSSSSVGDITSINAAKVLLDFLFLH
ncbi:MAG: agmatinase [Methanobacteriaceae archaeon]|nr:agmatinase [Methanobacteriaceae archaeon]